MAHPHACVLVIALGLGAGGCSGEYGLADETDPVEPVA